MPGTVDWFTVPIVVKNRLLMLLSMSLAGRSAAQIQPETAGWLMVPMSSQEQAGWSKELIWLMV